MKEKSFDIYLKNLAIGYQNNNKHPKVILKDINLKASAGEMIALVGGNGIGKSTLLKTLIKFQPYISGSIHINQKEITELKPKEIAQIMSIVSTDKIQVNNMTIFDLVAYGRFPYTGWMGNLTQQDKILINKSIEKVGINHLSHRFITEISDGEKQRALIARALAQDTPIILLDEPTAFLDVSNKYEIFHLLQTLAKEKNKTIIMSTHDLNIALSEVDKLWIITQNGYFEGAPEDAVLEDQLNRLFDNHHINFDYNEGKYFFKKELKSKVQVVGSGIPFKWTLRALNRKGYQIASGTNDFVIEVTDKEWIVNKNNQTKKYASIYSMLKEIDVFY